LAARDSIPASRKAAIISPPRLLLLPLRAAEVRLAPPFLRLPGLCQECVHFRGATESARWANCRTLSRTSYGMPKTASSQNLIADGLPQACPLRSRRPTRTRTIIVTLVPCLARWRQSLAAPPIGSTTAEHFDCRHALFSWPHWPDDASPRRRPLCDAP
jgi:hypothetical protein